MVNPILQSHRNDPGIFMQCWLLSQAVLSVVHSSMSNFCINEEEFNNVLQRSKEAKKCSDMLEIMNLPTQLFKCCLKPFEQVKFFFCGKNGDASVILFRKWIQSKTTKMLCKWLMEIISRKTSLISSSSIQHTLNSFWNPHSHNRRVYFCILYLPDNVRCLAHIHWYL